MSVEGNNNNVHDEGFNYWSSSSDSTEIGIYGSTKVYSRVLKFTILFEERVTLCYFSF